MSNLINKIIFFLTFLFWSNSFADINKENSNLPNINPQEQNEYAYVGLGEDSSSKVLNKSYRRDFYRYNPITDSWHKLNRFPGDRRTGAVCFILNGQAYVGCGQDEGDITLNIPERFREDIYKYDFDKDKWKEIAPFPMSLRKDMISFILNKEAYIGLGHFGAKAFSDIYKYDIKKNKWIKAFEYESKQNPKLVFTIDNKLYIGGNNFFCLDSSNDEWKQLKDIPENCNTDIVFIINGKAYTGFGGMEEKKSSKKSKRRKKKESKNFKDNAFYCYDPIKNTWTKLKSFPGKARKGCVSFSLNGKGYVGLGEDLNGKYYKEFYSYDPINNIWQKIADFPSKSRINAVAFVLKENKIN